MDSHNRGINAGIGMGNSVVRSAVYALSALNEDDEGPEERRKRIMARENGEALGALLGLAVGTISEITEEYPDEYGHEFK